MLVHTQISTPEQIHRHTATQIMFILERHKGSSAVWHVAGCFSDRLHPIAQEEQLAQVCLPAAQDSKLKVTAAPFQQQGGATDCRLLALLHFSFCLRPCTILQRSLTCSQGNLSKRPKSCCQHFRALRLSSVLFVPTSWVIWCLHVHVTAVLSGTTTSVLAYAEGLQIHGLVYYLYTAAATCCILSLCCSYYLLRYTLS